MRKLFAGSFVDRYSLEKDCGGMPRSFFVCFRFCAHSLAVLSVFCYNGGVLFLKKFMGKGVWVMNSIVDHMYVFCDHFRRGIGSQVGRYGEAFV